VLPSLYRYLQQSATTATAIATSNILIMGRIQVVFIQFKIFAVKPEGANASEYCF